MRIKLFLAFTALILLMSLGLAYQLYQLKQQQAAYVKNDLTAISQRLAAEVTFWSAMQMRRLTFLANLDAIKSMLPEQQQPILQSAVDPDDWSSLLFITDKDGHAVVRSDEQPLRSYSDRAYVSQILAGETSAQQLLISQNKPMPLQCFSAPIYASEFQPSYGTKTLNTENKKTLQGVLVQCAALEYIGKKFIASPDGLVESKSWLVDDNDRLIAHSDVENHAPKLQSFSDHPALVKTPNQFIKDVNVDGKKHTVAVSTLDFGWRLIVQQSYDEAYGQYEKVQFTLLWLSGILLIVAMCFSAILASHYSRPLKVLTEVVEKISKGRFPETIPYVDQESDVGHLAKAIDCMALNLRLALKRIRSGLAVKPIAKDD